MNSNYVFFNLALLQGTETSFHTGSVMFINITGFSTYIIQTRRQRYNVPELGSPGKFSESPFFPINWIGI